MTARLHTRPDDGEHRSARKREMTDRNCGHGGRPRFSDVAPVHDRKQRAGVRIQQDNGSQMRREILRRIVTKDRDQLRSKRRDRSGVGRHGGEERMSGRDLDDRADGLVHLSSRELRQSALHRFDEICHRQKLTDVGFV